MAKWNLSGTTYEVPVDKINMRSRSIAAAALYLPASVHSGYANAESRFRELAAEWKCKTTATFRDKPGTRTERDRLLYLLANYDAVVVPALEAIDAYPEVRSSFLDALKRAHVELVVVDALHPRQERCVVPEAQRIKPVPHDHGARIRMGKRMAAEQGRRQACAPFGYVLDSSANSGMRPVQELSWAIVRGFEMRLDGKTTDYIAKDFENLKIPAPNGSWKKSTICNTRGGILNGEYYCGLVIQGKKVCLQQDWWKSPVRAAAHPSTWIIYFDETVRHISAELYLDVARLILKSRRTQTRYYNDCFECIKSALSCAKSSGVNAQQK